MNRIRLKYNQVDFIQEEVDEIEEIQHSEEDKTRYFNEIGYNEIMDRCHIVSENLNEYVTTHPCVNSDEKLLELATLAESALCMLYQELGNRRLHFEEK